MEARARMADEDLAVVVAYRKASEEARAAAEAEARAAVEREATVKAKAAEEATAKRAKESWPEEKRRIILVLGARAVNEHWCS